MYICNTYHAKALLSDYGTCDTFVGCTGNPLEGSQRKQTKTEPEDGVNSQSILKEISKVCIMKKAS